MPPVLDFSWFFERMDAFPKVKLEEDRSKSRFALVVELVDTRDLKSLGTQVPCRFKSCPGHKGHSLMRGLFLCGFETMPFVACYLLV